MKNLNYKVVAISELPPVPAATSTDAQHRLIESLAEDTGAIITIVPGRTMRGVKASLSRAAVKSGKKLVMYPHPDNDNELVVRLSPLDPGVKRSRGRPRKESALASATPDNDSPDRYDAGGQ